MTSDAREIVWTRRLWPAVMLLGLGLGPLGCAAMPDPLPDDPPAPIRLPAFSGSKAKAEAFKKRVQDDPFPTAGQAGVGRAVAE